MFHPKPRRYHGRAAGRSEPPHHQKVIVLDHRVLVLIPTFNERANLETIVGRVLHACPDVNILILDDNSPDGTGVLADQLAVSDNRLSVMHRSAKEGLGAAYLAGFAYANDHQYSLVVEMDADGSHPAEVLPRMLEVMSSGISRGMGGVIGSRWVAGGGVLNWPAYRQVISRGGSIYARLMLGLRVRDVTAGYRVYPTAVLQQLRLDDLESRGYCFQIDMTRRLVGAGFSIAEVPITFRERELGESKMSQSIIVEAMARVTLWGLQRAGRRFAGLLGRR